MKKTKKILFVLIMLTVALIGCKDAKVTESEQFSGLYVATTFTQLDQLDGFIDVLAAGGTLTAEFIEDFKVNVYLDIPHEIKPIFGAPKGNYNGNFSINKDTLRFYNTGLFLDRTDFYFLIKESQVVLRDFTGTRLRAFRIIMTKK